MSFISVFDVLGPNMIGPSSSHTAGAAVNGGLAGKTIKFETICPKVRTGQRAALFAVSPFYAIKIL